MRYACSTIDTTVAQIVYHDPVSPYWDTPAGRADRAVFLHDTGQHEQALAQAQAALPELGYPTRLLRVAALSAAALGRAGLTEHYWRAGPRHHPDSAQAYNDLGAWLAGRGVASRVRAAEAESAYRQAIALRPDFADAYYNLGNLLAETRRPLEAEAAYRQSITLQPDDAEAHNNLGVLLRKSKRLAEAEAAFHQALALRGDYAEAFNNLGNLHLERHNWEAAEAAFRQAIALRPERIEAYSNLGRLLMECQRPAESETMYRRALALQPDAPELQWNLSLLLLRKGCYAEAWPLHEARYHPNHREPASVLPAIPAPRWQGESLAGKAILVWPEQGYGDDLQFVRYIPLLKAAGAARVILACKPALTPLLASVAGADVVVDYGALASVQTSPPDFWCFIASLPLHFQTRLDSIPATLPYLKPAPERLNHWRSGLPPAAFRVGLVWKGAEMHQNDANRSLPLAALAPLWSVAQVRFISLQKGQGEQEARHPPPGQALDELGTRLGDFADSAAIVAQLDLVICVDTAIAHLAGALGKPCWVLLPAHGTDWRWLEDREDSPWYPGVLRLFRQGREESWEPVVQRVAQALAALVSAPNPARAQEPPADLALHSRHSSPD